MKLPFAEQSRQVQPLALDLRPYQRAAVDAIYTWFDERDGNPLVVVPTGGGKSVLIAAFAHGVLSQWPKERLLVVTHVRELIAQNHATMLRCWPDAPAGIYSAGIGRREHDAPILFCGIQSVYLKAKQIGWTDLVLVDEAHLIPRAGFGMYRQFLEDLRSMNPKLKVIGFTATPFRTDSGSLDAGDDRMFHGIAYNCELLPLIEQGWLAPVVSRGTKASINTSDVHLRGGEFVEGELQQAALTGDLVSRAVAELVARGADRRAWLVFCCGIEHALAVLGELGRHGVAAAAVFGDTPKHERDQVVADFRTGKLRAVVNVNVLTTGFDVPHVDLIALLRPTMSPGLYVQMVGRGLRRAESKTDCLVLDFGGNVMRHGPLNDVRIQQPEKGGTSESQAKECPQCSMLVSPATRACACGFEFPAPERTPDHDEKPDENSDLLRQRSSFETWRVQDVSYAEHRKPDRPPSVCVTYWCGYHQRVREWVCFEHAGYPKKKAADWWRAHGGPEPVPHTTDLALCLISCGVLREPFEIVVDVRGEYPELRGVRLCEQVDDQPENNGRPPPQAALNDDEIPF